MSFKKEINHEPSYRRYAELVPSVRTRTFTPNYSLCVRVGLCWFVVINFCCFFASCGNKNLPVRELPIERDGQQIAVVKAEIARAQEERRRGLMHRNKLPDGEGMLFVFETDDIQSFWMKNTLIPLSIGFIGSDGRINEIKDMYPHDENSVLSSRSARYALEVPQGWFSRAGVRTGDVVKIEN